MSQKRRILATIERAKCNAHPKSHVCEMGSNGGLTATATNVCHFLLKLRIAQALAGMFLAGLLVPATAQVTPGVFNTPIAVGTAGYGVVEAGDGNFYAMSLRKPDSCASDASMICSYIYQIAADRVLTNYHSFQPVSNASPTPSNLDGLEPTALIVGIDGNLYGTCRIGGPGGFGTIFKIATGGTLTVLASFGVNTAGTALDPGNEPLALIQGADGNLYFVNALGVYSISTTGGAVNTVATIPYSQANSSDPDGANASSIMQASDGNFYLTVETTPGILTGTTGSNAGGIIQVTPGGTINVVHTFAVDGSEGLDPYSPLIQGPDGFLYGATRDSSASTGNGMAFKVQPSANGSFLSLGPLPGQDSGSPSNALYLGADGNLYGTTPLGGATASPNCTPLGCGILFRMSPSGTFTTVYAFQGGNPASLNTLPTAPIDGAFPNSPVIQRDNGDFVGGSIGLANNSPVFFEIDPGGQVNVPVKLTVTPSVAGVNAPVKVTWTVSNAFSDTAQNCGAVVEGGLSGVGAWSGRQTGTLVNGIYSGSTTITPTQAGAYTIGLICGGNEAGFTDLQVSQQLQITSLTLPKGVVNVAYKATLTAAGGTPEYTWSAANLPPGLTLDSLSGILSGTPTQFGSYSLVVTAKDSANPASEVNATVALTIDSGLKILTPSLVKATVNAQYDQNIRAQFGLPPYTWTITSGTLPQGLQFLSGTPSAYFQGSPSVSGDVTITVQVADSESTPAMQTATYVLKVADAVQIAAVEFTQAIQQFQTLDDLETTLSATNEPPVPIVAGKRAVMRVYFTELKDTTNVTLTVTGSVVGVKPFAITPRCRPTDQRSASGNCRSLDFYFVPPTGAWSTVLTLTDDQDSQLEQETLNITSRTTATVAYKGLSICSVLDQPNSCQNPLGLLNLTWFASKVLPTNNVTPFVTPFTLYEALVDPAAFEPWENELTDDVNTLYTPSDAQGDTSTNSRTDYVGIYNGAIDSTGVGVLGGHGLIIPNVAVRQGVTGTPQILAHETGHTLNLTHTGLDTPPGSTVGTCWGTGLTPGESPASLNWIFISNLLQSLDGNVEYGFDVFQQTVIDGSGTFDMMAYCMSRWISPYNYKNMFPLLNGGTVTSPNVKRGSLMHKPQTEPKAEAKPKPRVTYTQGKYMQVSGSIPSTGIAINPIFTETTTGISDPGTGTYSIEEQDAGGQVLYTRNFTPVVGTTDTVGTDFTSDPLFNEFVPQITGATSISVLDPTGNALTSLAMGTPPTVAITSPAPGFVGTGVQSISWAATSGTATNFTSRIYYSIDNGITWQNVLQSAGTSAPLDFSTLPGATAALLRIDVSDGVNTGSATSIPFSVPKKTPSTVVINAPASGSTLVAANGLFLAGAAYDADDGMLTGSALQWSDSVQGNLGAGSPLTVNLKPGAHAITLTATDSDGNAITATTEITLGGDPPAVTLTIPNQPGACLTANVNAIPGALGADLTSVGYSLDGGATYIAIPLTSLPFSFPLSGTGVETVVAAAVDGSGQVGSQSQDVNLGAGCGVSTPKVNTGSGQSAIVGSAFSTALTTLVVDQNSNPVSGVTVTYAVPASGASATLSAATATTNTSGIATVTATANGIAGAYNVTASTPKGSSTAIFALTNSDFQIAAASGTLTVPRGSSADDVITITALDGFSGAVTFGCKGLPAGTTCSFAPDTLTPMAATASTKMTIAASQTASIRRPVGGLSLAVCALLACLIRRRKYFSGLALIVCTTALFGLTACGSSSHKQTSTASITVTASAGAIQRTTTITLQIQ